MPEGHKPRKPEVTPKSPEVRERMAEMKSIQSGFNRQAVQPVFLEKAVGPGTDDQALWVAIRNRTSAIAFNQYDLFIDRVLCDQTVASDDEDSPNAIEQNIAGLGKKLGQRPIIYGPDVYHVLKLATQAFLLVQAGIYIKPLPQRTPGDPHRYVDKEDTASVSPDRLGRSIESANDFNALREDLTVYLESAVGATGRSSLYLKRIVDALTAGIPQETTEAEGKPYCDFILQGRFTNPSLLELIWSYWQEEGMLVQTMNAITRRFQNKRNGPRDPLANLEIDPLRPLNNLLWGLIQDEQDRLTVPRRAYEYDHHYGLSLVGKAVPRLESADSRSKFVEAFHNLLHRASIFFREDADATIQADAFPLLNTLKEVHLILAEGAHNQFGDLPWTARAEMLSMQWLLGRPEMREFLRGRPMVPYHERWMGAVDAMKKLQGWGDTTVMHFHELAVTGERIILSVRYGDWINLDNTEDQARNWARYWKPEIQQYMHAYHAVTGIDLSADVTDTGAARDRYLQPSVLLQRRLSGQRPARALPPAPAGRRRLTSEVTGYVAMELPDRSRLLSTDGE